MNDKIGVQIKELNLKVDGKTLDLSNNKTFIKLTTGSKLQISKKMKEVKDDLVILKNGENLEILYSDGSSLMLEGFYSLENVSIELPTAENEIHVLSSNFENSNDTSIVYTQGDMNFFNSLFKDNNSLVKALNEYNHSLETGLNAGDAASASQAASAGLFSGISTTALVIGGVLLTGGIVALASGGGGSSEESSSDDDKPAAPVYKKGQLVDSFVAGVDYYINGSTTPAGKTAADGSFTFRSGDTVTFKVAGITIGSNISVPSDGIVLIQDLVGVDRSEVTNPEVVKIAQFLQTLDSDGNATNGITITNTTLDYLETVIGTPVIGALNLNAVFKNTVTIVTSEDAIAHLNATMIDGNYVVNFDTVAPTVTIATDDDALNIGDDAVITFTFTEAPATLPTITPSAGTLGTLVQDVNNPLIYTATLTPPANTASGTISFTVASWTDAAGNTGTTVSNPATVSVDTVAPIVGTKAVDSNTLTIETDSVLAGTPLSSEFTVLVGSTTLNSADYTVSLDEQNIVITLNTPITRSDIVKVAYTGTSVTDVAGNTVSTFTSATVTNQTPSGIDSTVTAVAFEEPSLSITLTGTNFNKILDLGNGELYTTDVKDRLNWDNLDWYINGTTKIDFLLADISSVYVNNNTTITITITQAKWDAIASFDSINLLGSVDDTINITAGFLKDADGTAATTDASIETLSSSYDGVIPTTDVYSKSIILNGAGDLDASFIKNVEGTLLNLNDSDGGTNEDIGISSIGSNIGVIQNDKESGTVTITGWDADAVIDGMTILNNSTSNLEVFIDNLAGGLSLGTQINDLGFMGDNINIFFDDASANISFFNASQTLEYLGDGTIDGGLNVTGFSSTEDIINLSSLASVLDGDSNGILDSNIFESGSDSLLFANSTFLGYDTTTGELLYDADGFNTGSTSAIVLLTLTDYASTGTVVEADIKVI